MQAVKAVYKEGNIHLLTPLVGVSEAGLFAIVLDKDDQATEVAQSFRAIPSNSEQEFQTIGLGSFFDTEDDNDVNWEGLFDVKAQLDKQTSHHSTWLGGSNG